MFIFRSPEVGSKTSPEIRLKSECDMAHKMEWLQVEPKRSLSHLVPDEILANFWTFFSQSAARSRATSSAEMKSSVSSVGNTSKARQSRVPRVSFIEVTMLL